MHNSKTLLLGKTKPCVRLLFLVKLWTYKLCVEDWVQSGQTLIGIARKGYKIESWQGIPLVQWSSICSESNYPPRDAPAGLNVFWSPVQMDRKNTNVICFYLIRETYMYGNILIDVKWKQTLLSLNPVFNYINIEWLIIIHVNLNLPLCVEGDCWQKS